jgi:zinc D-Ala-D-Ala carboxypeptidase
MSYSINDVTAWLETMAAGTISLLVDNSALARDALDLVMVDHTLPPEIDGQLSANFTWREFLYSDTAAASDEITNVPTDRQVLVNLERLANTMEFVRSLCGDNTVVISSGYRSPDTNAAVGGVPDSAHLSGCACDFTIPDWGDVTAVVKTIQPAMEDLQIDQLIHEGTWVHLGLAVPPNSPRYECFAI